LRKLISISSVYELFAKPDVELSCVRNQKSRKLKGHITHWPMSSPEGTPQGDSVGFPRETASWITLTGTCDFNHTLATASHGTIHTQLRGFQQENSNG
jgi:hypothetical protein